MKKEAFSEIISCELTPIIFNTVLTHLGSEASIYFTLFIKIWKSSTLIRLLVLLPYKANVWCVSYNLCIKRRLCWIRGLIHNLIPTNPLDFLNCYLYVQITCHNKQYSILEASKPKWVNPTLNSIGVNSLWLGGLHIMYKFILSVFYLLAIQLL